MTTDKAALLMNRYFDNEATDDELRELFLHLSESQEQRSLLATMKQVHETLIRKPDIDFPEGIDHTFSVLGMGDHKKPLMSRRFTISVPSAMLSAFVICLLSLVLYSVVSKSLSYQQANEQRSVMNSMSLYGTESYHPNYD